MSTDILILHLTELHFGCKNRFAQHDPANLGMAFAKAIKKDKVSLGIAPDVSHVFVTGDITESGHPKEYEQGAVFFGSMASALGLSTKRFVFIPGNHDHAPAMSIRNSLAMLPAS